MGLGRYHLVPFLRTPNGSAVSPNLRYCIITGRRTACHNRVTLDLAFNGSMICERRTNSFWPMQKQHTYKRMLTDTDAQRIQRARLQTRIHPYTPRSLLLSVQDGLFGGPRDCRWSHGGRHLWIGCNSITTTQRGALSIRIGNTEIHTLHVLDGRRLDECLCPYGDGTRALWLTGAWMPASRAELIRVFGASQLCAVPVEYAGLCNGLLTDAGVLVVPKIGARAWLRSHLGGAPFEEVNLSAFGGLGPAAVVQTYSFTQLP